MKVIIFEGTPQEISEALPDISARSFTPPNSAPPISNPAAPIAGAQASPTASRLDHQYVGVEVARRVLRRRDWRDEPLGVLRALYNAYPNAMSSAELQAAINYSRPQFTGLMGAIGRRVANTDGFVEGTRFFERRWDHENGTNRYGLPESVREAMRLERLI